MAHRIASRQSQGEHKSHRPLMPHSHRKSHRIAAIPGRPQVASSSHVACSSQVALHCIMCGTECVVMRYILSQTASRSIRHRPPHSHVWHIASHRGNRRESTIASSSAVARMAQVASHRVWNGMHDIPPQTASRSRRHHPPQSHAHNKSVTSRRCHCRTVQQAQVIYRISAPTL
jgi:hypothetical protein